MAVQDRPGHLDHRLVGIRAQRGQCTALERVQRVTLPAFEWQVGDEAIFHSTIMGADPVAELDRQGGGDRYGAGYLHVVGGPGGDLPVRLEHPADDVAGIEAAHVVDDPAGLAGLEAQQPLGQAAQVESDGQGQRNQPEQDSQDEQRTHRSLLANG